MSARGRVLGGGVSGRTHRSAPTRWGRRSEPTENWCEDGPCQRGDGARPLQGEREWTDDGVWSPRPTGATQVMPSNGPMWASAPTERRESHINHPGQRRTAKRLRQRVGEMGRERGRDHPRSVHQRRTIPQSRPLAVTAPFTQGSLGDGGCGLPRRPCGPPRNDNGFLSFRGAERRGNPPSLRWTGVQAAEVVGPYEKEG